MSPAIANPLLGAPWLALLNPTGTEDHAHEAPIGDLDRVIDVISEVFEKWYIA